MNPNDDPAVKNSPMVGILGEVMHELNRAQARFGPMASAHEGLAVILEEFDELKQHVWTNQKRRDKHAMRKEALQLCAMAARFVHDVCDAERRAAPYAYSDPKAPWPPDNDPDGDHASEDLKALRLDPADQIPM